jgi:methionyl-tRNA formyltransferase
VSVSVPPNRRVAFFGTPEISASYLRALITNGFDVPLVVTRLPKRRGRGSSLLPSPVEELAHVHGIRVVYSLEEVDPSYFDIGLVVAFGRLIPKDLLNTRPLINVHYSLLPRFRGAAPMQWSILSNDAISGVTLMRITEELDAGHIFDQRSVSISGLYLSEISRLLTSLGTEMVIDWFSRDDDWYLTGAPQVGEVTFAPKLDKEFYRIDWSKTVAEALAKVRLEQAYTTAKGRRLKILRAETAAWGENLANQHEHGEVISSQSYPGGVLCRDGLLIPLRVKPEGSREMSFEDFLRGMRTNKVILGG